MFLTRGHPAKALLLQYVLYMRRAGTMTSSPSLANNFLNRDLGRNLLLKRGPYPLRSHGLLEHPNPSVSDDYQKLSTFDTAGASSVGKELL